jgi:hypothetical protein
VEVVEVLGVVIGREDHVEDALRGGVADERVKAHRSARRGGGARSRAARGSADLTLEVLLHVPHGAIREAELGDVDGQRGAMLQARVLRGAAVGRLRAVGGDVEHLRDASLRRHRREVVEREDEPTVEDLHR